MEQKTGSTRVQLSFWK